MDKTNDKDAVLIARLTAELRCYRPEPGEECWARLRHLGMRRERLITEAVACVHQVRAAWAVVHHNPVFATRFAHLTRREHNRLAVGQAYAAIAAAVLRQLHAVITRHQAWDPLIASGHVDVDMAA